MFKYFLTEMRAPLFDLHPYIDPENHIYLKLRRKARWNKVDTSSHTSKELLTHALNQDCVNSVVLGLRYHMF